MPRETRGRPLPRSGTAQAGPLPLGPFAQRSARIPGLAANVQAGRPVTSDRPYPRETRRFQTDVEARQIGGGFGPSQQVIVAFFARHGWIRTGDAHHRAFLQSSTDRTWRPAASAR